MVSAGPEHHLTDSLFSEYDLPDEVQWGLAAAGFAFIGAGAAGVAFDCTPGGCAWARCSFGNGGRATAGTARTAASPSRRACRASLGTIRILIVVSMLPSLRLTWIAMAGPARETIGM